MSHPDYLEALRERYGPDAATREPDPDACDCGDPDCGWYDRRDPDADAEPDDAGEWLGHRRVEVVQPRGEFL